MEQRHIYIEGATFVEGKMVSGVEYTAAEWQQKQLADQLARIEAKLDATIAHLGPGGSEVDG